MSEQNLLDDAIWEGVSAEAEAAFLQGGEEMVKATLALGQGADFRAVTVMGIFGSVGVALFAAVATLLAGSHPFLPATIAATITGLGLFVAAGLCAAAAWPGQFFVAGFEPRSLVNSSAKQDRFRNRVLIAVVQDRIDYNRRAIARAARLLMGALLTAGFSLFLGSAALIVLSTAPVYQAFVEKAHPPVSVMAHAAGQSGVAGAGGAAAGTAVGHRP
jgi:hypothetical protein